MLLSCQVSQAGMLQVLTDEEAAQTLDIITSWQLSHNFPSAKFCPYITKGKRKINVKKKVFQNVES